jgi:hypothetical protein
LDPKILGHPAPGQSVQARSIPALWKIEVTTSDAALQTGYATLASL